MAVVGSDYGPVLLGAVITIGAAVVAGGVRLSYKFGNLLGKIIERQDDQGRRLKVLETAAIHGPAVAREVKRQIEPGDVPD
jgi:hypothetical protein